MRALSWRIAVNARRGDFRHSLIDRYTRIEVLASIAMDPKDKDNRTSHPAQQRQLLGLEHQLDTSLPSDEADRWMGEKRELERVVTDFKELANTFRRLTVIKPGPEALDEMEKALARLPSGDSLAKIVEDLRSKAAQVIKRSRHERIDSFKRFEAEFIRLARSSGENAREVAEGWRVGPLELQVRQEKAQCRTLYNREVLINWSCVTSTEDIQRITDKSLALLKKALLPETTMADSFWEAYEECRSRRGATGKGNPDVVPLIDFYRELRLTLARRDLAQRADKKFSYADFPRWAFLYNLDVYFSRSASLPPEKRLTLQTGSQQETRRIGFVVNGLDALQDYKVVCFIRKS